MEPKYVRVIKNWYPKEVEVTIGRVYTFPDIVFDNGKVYNLNSDFEGCWIGYLEVATKEEYDRQTGLTINLTLNYLIL